MKPQGGKTKFGLYDASEAILEKNSLINSIIHRSSSNGSNGPQELDEINMVDGGVVSQRQKQLMAEISNRRSAMS